MAKIAEQAGEYVSWVFESFWDWLFLLNHQEWMLLLAIVAAAGFLCMRGFGSRHNF
jgi:hypothetical protein